MNIIYASPIDSLSTKLYKHNEVVVEVWYQKPLYKGVEYGWRMVEVCQSAQQEIRFIAHGNLTLDQQWNQPKIWVKSCLTNAVNGGVVSADVLSSYLTC